MSGKAFWAPAENKKKWRKKSSLKNSLEKGEGKYAARDSAYTKAPNYKGDEEYLKWHKIWLEIQA